MSTIKYLVPRDARDVGPGWESCPMYDDPAEAARAWDAVGSPFPIRLRIDGQISHGSYEQVKPVYDELHKLREGR